VIPEKVFFALVAARLIYAVMPDAFLPVAFDFLAGFSSECPRCPGEGKKKIPKKRKQKIHDARVGACT
jgi:hypothetical protein